LAFRSSSRTQARETMSRSLVALALAASARAQTEECCTATSNNRLHFETPVASTVAGGSWTDFYFVAENEGESVAFEVVAATNVASALQVYVYDGNVADATTSAEDRCLLCDGVTPLSTLAITSVTALRPATPTMTMSALDSDTVSHIGNSTHKRYFTYVGECYYMPGSVYYVSVYNTYSDDGDSDAGVGFSIEAQRVQSTITVGNTSFLPNTTGTVCDGKYLHYFFDWPSVHPGGLQAVVRKTSGMLETFYMRYERCVGEWSYLRPSVDKIAAVNLLGQGLGEGKVRLPNSQHRLVTGRYYISVRAAVDMCGDYNISVRNLTIAEAQQLRLEEEGLA